MSTDIVCGRCGQRYTLGVDTAETVMVHFEFCSSAPKEER